MGLKVMRRFCISSFWLGLPKLSLGCCHGCTHALLVAAIPIWHNGDAVDGDTVAYCTVKTAVTPQWQELEKAIKSQQAQYIPGSLNLKRSKSKSNDTGSSICSCLLVAGESSSHCNLFTESINKLIPFKQGVHLHGTVLEAGMHKYLQCREKTGLLFSFQDKARKEMRETTFPTNPLILQCEGISAFHLIWYLWKLLMSRNMHLSSLILALTFPSCRETSVDAQELAMAQLHC